LYLNGHPLTGAVSANLLVASTGNSSPSNTYEASVHQLHRFAYNLYALFFEQQSPAPWTHLESIDAKRDL